VAQPSTTTAPRRLWANTSLAAAVVWIILAILPVPGTTLVGVPFGGYAILAGIVCHFERRAAGDRTGARRAGWGAGLGCVGFVLAFALDILVAGAVITALVAAARVASGVHLR
jgi:hypothetical protein